VFGRRWARRLISEEKWNAGTRKDYIKLIDHMDLSIGRLLLILEREGLRDNTVVIFISDNGGTKLARNAPYSGTKSTLYEGGIRVPCIVRWPGRLPRNKTINWPAMTFDLTASILRIADAAPPAGQQLDGIDMIQHVQQKTTPDHRLLYWRSKRGERTWRAIRDGQMKYLERQDGDKTQQWLFNLKNDPAEQESLAQKLIGEPERLKSLLNQWEQDVKPVR